MQKYADVVLDRKGNVVPGASVRVKTSAGTDAVLYSANGTGPISNPITTDNLGRFSFYALNGRYNLQVYIGSALFTVSNDILLEDPMDETPEVIKGGTIKDVALINVTIDGKEPGYKEDTEALDLRVDDIDGRWCGISDTRPATRLDESPLQVGDECQDPDDERFYWSGDAWVSFNSAAQALEVALASPLGPTKIDRSAFFVDSIQELIGLPQKLGSKAVVTSYHSSGSVGGGIFVFDGSKLRSSHDGMNIFSPTVPFTWADFGASYLYGAGETLPSIGGCWVRQSADSNCFNSGAIVNTNITMSIRKAIQVSGGAAILKGSYIITPGIISISSYQFVIGAGKGVTVLTLDADTADWGMRSKGNYNCFSRMTIQAKPGTTKLTGHLLQAENDGFVTYKQEFKELYLKGVSSSALGRGINFFTESDSGKGITFPIVDDVDGWNLRSVLYFSKSGTGFTDSGVFTRIRASICAYAVDMEPKGLGSSKFQDVHGRYDAGFTLGLIIDRGTRTRIKDCLMYDFASPYIFVEPESIGCIIDATTLVSQGSSVQDKGWGTKFIGSPNSVTPESSGGAGYGWLEQHDNCLGFDPSRNWNVTKTGTSNVIYTGGVSLLGPMMRMTASGAAGSSASLDYATSYALNPFQQTKLSAFFWIPNTPANAKFEAGIYNSAGTTSVSLVADASVSPNFYFLIKQSGSADVIIDTGKPVGTKRHAFGITRTGTAGGLTLHFDFLVIATGIVFSEATSLLQPRFKLSNVTTSTTDVYMSGITLRTTSDNYVTDWSGAL